MGLLEEVAAFGFVGGEGGGAELGGGLVVVAELGEEVSADGVGALGDEGVVAELVVELVEQGQAAGGAEGVGNGDDAAEADRGGGL